MSTNLDDLRAVCPASRRSPPAVALILLMMSSVVGGLSLGGCATAPPAQLVPAITYEQKLGWILRLEDQRILRDPLPAPADPPVAVRPRRPATAVSPPLGPDLVRLASDPDARVRRRAALAIGRVRLDEGVSTLTGMLADPDPEVRQMAAFGLGLIGSAAGTDALVDALRDADPVVQGRAAEGLGLIGEDRAAQAIAEMVSTHVQAGVLAGIAPDDLSYPLAGPVEAVRLGLYALTRLKSYEGLAGTMLDGSGQPISHWWPVAYSFQRLEDPRATPALVTLARADAPDTVAFAARGLGQLKDPALTDVLLPLLDRWRTAPRVMASTVRALGDIGDSRAAPALVRLLQDRSLDEDLRIDALDVLGGMGAAEAAEYLLDGLGSRRAPVRAAAIRALARVDAELFLMVLSTLDPDSHWSVRAALAEALSAVEAEVALPRLHAMLEDADQRVIPAVLASLVRLGDPAVGPVLLERLGHSDVVVRAAAARHLGELGRREAVPALVEAYRGAAGDPTYLARAAILEALATFGDQAARETLMEGLDDPDWAVRIQSVDLLRQQDPGSDYGARIRPAPGRREPAAYDLPVLVSPPFSPHVYLETEQGTIQIELAVLDAPMTCDNFIALARAGFFNGLQFHRVVPNFVVQDGDPRGDGEGGPGYTIRDELNERPYLRGTVGMALDWRDTGGSQFFITHSPQPHLDARYTVFGRVIAGMDVVDRLRRWDRIERVRVWDGVEMR
jgi:HEAT repeat protein/cyclophilin family peptidyl-prolyl cis-trans isomerase